MLFFKLKVFFLQKRNKGLTYLLMMFDLVAKELSSLQELNPGVKLLTEILATLGNRSLKKFH